jgi:hypothetical protein
MFCRLTNVAVAAAGITMLGAGETEGSMHSAFDTLLQRYVSEAGVDYAAWHANESDRQGLKDYIASLEQTPISQLEEQAGGRDIALAYWINLYNAATLNLVLDGYPTTSIKKLGGLFSSPWKQDIVEVEGEKRTLNEIENDIIRPRFEDPRIHFALNCAARGCPPLRAGAFVAENLDAQLEEQTRAFLGNPKQNWIDEEGNLRLSKILDWYKDDFVKEAGSVQAYVRPYMTKPGEAGPDEETRVKHLDYDWSLNDSGVYGGPDS